MVRVSRDWGRRRVLRCGLVALGGAMLARTLENASDWSRDA